MQALQADTALQGRQRQKPSHAKPSPAQPSPGISLRNSAHGTECGCLQGTPWPRLRKTVQQKGQRVRCQAQNFPELKPRSIVTMAKRGKHWPREAAGFSEDENTQSLTIRGDNRRITWKVSSGSVADRKLYWVLVTT